MTVSSESPRVVLYARVSQEDRVQSIDNQIGDLQEYAAVRGWKIQKKYVDVGFIGEKESRPALKELMNDAKKRYFDVLLVWKFDRFSRSVKHLILSLSEFEHLGIDFISFTENFDTSSPIGKVMFVLVGAFAQLEKELMSERVKAGMRRAKRNGTKLGRPVVYCPPIRCRELLKLHHKGLSYRDLAKKTGFSHATVGNLLRKAQEESDST